MQNINLFIIGTFLAKLLRCFSEFQLFHSLSAKINGFQTLRCNNYNKNYIVKLTQILLALVITGRICSKIFYFLFSRYEPGRRDLEECRYNQNEGYVIFSAMGSFFIPMAVMIYVYVRISCVVASRHDNMTEIEVHKVIFISHLTQMIKYFISSAQCHTFVVYSVFFLLILSQQYIT